MKTLRKLKYIPEILYHAPEYEGQRPDPIPFVVIPKDHDMPVGLFITEYRKTGEFEPGPTGEPEEIEEGPFPHMFVDFEYIMECMETLFPTLDIVDARKQIRVALGLLPTKEQSRAAGEAILKKVEAKETELREQAKVAKQEKASSKVVN